MRLLIFIYLTFVSCTGWSQIPIVSEDSTLSDIRMDMETVIGHAIADDVYVLDSVSFSKVFVQWFKKSDGGMVSLKNSETNWEIGMNNFYANGQSMSYFGEGLYTNLALENRTTILGLPIRLSGSLVAQNDQLNTRLSTLAIEFDYERFINRFRGKISQGLSAKSFQELPAAQKQLLRENLSVEVCRSTIVSEKYREFKTNLQKQIDSLELDLTNYADSTVLDSLKKRREKIEKWEYKTDSIYQTLMSKWEDVQTTLQSLQQAVSKQQHELEEKIERGNLHEIAKKYPEMQQWASIWSSISKFNIGSFRMAGSPFDISSIPVHGIGFELRRNGYYAAISYGKEGQQQRALPDYIRNLRLAGEGRQVAHIKAGVGMPDNSHFHLSFSHIQAPGTIGDTLTPAFAKRNVLVSIDSRWLVSNRFYIEVTGSLSNTDYTGKAKSGELLQQMYDKMVNGGHNLACLARTGWKDETGKIDFSIGYQLVGSEFTTLGNLFLLKNRNTIRLEGKHRFWDNRFQAKVTYVHGMANSSNDLYPGVRQNQFSGDLSFRIDKRGSRVWVNYSPNYYLQQAPGTSQASVYQLNLATVGAQYMYLRSKNGQWMTLLQATNFNDQAQYGDTSTVSGLWYGMLIQNWSSEKYTFTVLSNIGVEQHNPGSIKDLNIDLSQTFNLKHFQISQGIQVVKRYFDATLLSGGSAGIQLKTLKKIRLGLNLTYLFGVSKNTQNQFFINTTMGWQF